jgi:hypothetical protein
VMATCVTDYGYGAVEGVVWILSSNDADITLFIRRLVEVLPVAKRACIVGRFYICQESRKGTSYFYISSPHTAHLGCVVQD